MFRLIRAELKKLFTRPAIYIITGVLVLVLALSSFVFDNSISRRQNLMYSPTDDTTVSTIYDEFIRASGTSIKSNSVYEYTEEINNAYELYELYSSELENDLITVLHDKVTYIESLFNLYSSAYRTTTVDNDTNNNILEEKGVRVKNALADFGDFYSINVSNAGSNVRVLSTKTQNERMSKYITKAIGIWTNGLAGRERHRYIIEQLEDKGIMYKKTLDTYIDELILFEPDVTYVSSLSVYFDGVATKLGLVYNEADHFYELPENRENYTGLMLEIYNFAQENSSMESAEYKKELIRKITNFKMSSSEVHNIVANGIKINGLRNFSAVQISNYVGFENDNLYELQEIQTRNVYYYDTNTHASDYNNPFSVSQTSGTTVSAYDYANYALRLCAFIIVIYIVLIGASAIAGEQSQGTLKLLAIRPFSRAKLLTAKILATLLHGVFMIVMAALITLILGFISYGIPQGSLILGVFNASSAFVVSNFQMFLITLLTLIFEMIFFAVIAIMISTVFKTNVGAVAISMLIYFGTLILNTLATASPGLRFLPFVNVNLYKYFGSAFVSSSSFVSSVLTPAVILGATFWFSFIYAIVVIAIMLYVTYLLFTKRDIK